MTNVPLWQMYLYDKRNFMTNVPLWQTYLYDKCTFMTGVPLWQMYFYDICFMTNVFMTNVPLWQMYLYDKRNFMTNVPLWQAYLYDKCFYEKRTITTNIILWQKYLYDKRTFMTNVLLWQVFLWQKLLSLHWIESYLNKYKQHSSSARKSLLSWTDYCFWKPILGNKSNARTFLAYTYQQRNKYMTVHIFCLIKKRKSNCLFLKGKKYMYIHKELISLLKAKLF